MSLLRKGEDKYTIDVASVGTHLVDNQVHDESVQRDTTGPLKGVHQKVNFSPASDSMREAYLRPILGPS